MMMDETNIAVLLEIDRDIFRSVLTVPFVVEVGMYVLVFIIGRLRQITLTQHRFRRGSPFFS
jgi:hypothetical protein